MHRHRMRPQTEGEGVIRILLATYAVLFTPLSNYIPDRKLATGHETARSIERINTAEGKA